MSIQKKSLISTLKATKKANVASGPVAQGSLKKENVASMRNIAHPRNIASMRNVAHPRAVISQKRNLRSLKAPK